jgi:hypothetical protein
MRIDITSHFLTTTYSQVDIEAPDLSQHPLFAEADSWEVLLNSGDMLFIPAFYWHQVGGASVCFGSN